ncbi:hypothetical protein DPMN_152936 [Dreissena polymorpha]|uniref:Uncharacterized protein n=1 Tax=Dreissena polymorpha TaxID=45954 RepID=A0A9D4FHP3_DREPO|nr:hypothetical protein DPMN_152936 [Dreissena polymorpha]
MTSTGRVFVFGSSVSQVDTDGKKVLNSITLDMPSPGSVYINEDTNKMIVGLWNNDNVIVFKTKTKLTLLFIIFIHNIRNYQ